MADQYRIATNAAYHFAIAGGPVAAAIIDAAIVAGVAGRYLPRRRARATRTEGHAAGHLGEGP
jgi:hypothetical protein